MTRWRGRSAARDDFFETSERGVRGGGAPPTSGCSTCAIVSTNACSLCQCKFIRTRRQIGTHGFAIIVKEAHLDAPWVLPVLRMLSVWLQGQPGCNAPRACIRAAFCEQHSRAAGCWGTAKRAHTSRVDIRDDTAALHPCISDTRMSSACVAHLLHHQAQRSACAAARRLRSHQPSVASCPYAAATRPRLLQAPAHQVAQTALISTGASRTSVSSLNSVIWTKGQVLLTKTSLVLTERRLCHVAQERKARKKCARRNHEKNLTCLLFRLPL